jgi:hypothetical protein
MPSRRYLEWKVKNRAVGCVFARYMATKPAEFGQRIELLTGAASGLAAQIEAHVSSAISDPAAAALTLIFPDATDLGDLVTMALALEQVPGWHVTRTRLAATPGGDVVAFGLARDVPLATGALVPSEALVLGPFDAFPATRKAPVTALEMFVGVPPDTSRKDGGPTTKSNLADVDVSAPQPFFDNMWRNSIAGRLASLGGIQDERAKARVAFVVPTTLAQTMGCLP